MLDILRDSLIYDVVFLANLQTRRDAYDLFAVVMLTAAATVGGLEIFHGPRGTDALHPSLEGKQVVVRARVIRRLLYLLC